MTEWDAPEYARISALQEAMSREVLELLKLERNERVLDVGCGQGKITAQIASRTPRGSVVGVDPSHDMISFAQSHFGALPNLRFQVADARALPFTQEFDLVVSFNALHWVPDQEAALRSIHNALVRDGKAQLRLVPAGPRQSLESVVEDIRREAKWDTYFRDFADPYLRLTAEEYGAVAQRCGFRVVQITIKDPEWDFGSRAAFAHFSAVGCVAWTSCLPQEERAHFIDEVLDRYREIAGGDGATFKFYQMDVHLACAD
jgi:trans-aconitate 2-methyltransferase